MFKALQLSKLQSIFNWDMHVIWENTVACMPVPRFQKKKKGSCMSGSGKKMYRKNTRHR